jgi:predicted RNA binding protein YcfA (HicA-like mRNA interferase family)
MKIPRDITGAELVKLVERYGYCIVRQKGSHIRLVTQVPHEHYITIPNHKPLKIGTLSNILADIAIHRGVLKEDIMADLFA